MKFNQFDGVRLVVDLPEEGLRVGMHGCVVDVYSKPLEGYEVEILEDGRTLWVGALRPEQLELTHRQTP